jgi:hypothetical protein
MGPVIGYVAELSSLRFLCFHWGFRYLDCCHGFQDQSDSVIGFVAVIVFHNKNQTRSHIIFTAEPAIKDTTSIVFINFC